MTRNLASPRIRPLGSSLLLGLILQLSRLFYFRCKGSGKCDTFYFSRSTKTQWVYLLWHHENSAYGCPFLSICGNWTCFLQGWSWGNAFFICWFFFFFFCLAAACRVPGPGMEPMSQLWPEPLQGQCLILDPLCHRRTPTLCIFNLVQILPTQCSFLFTLRTRHQSFLLFLFASFKVTDSALFQHYAVVAPPVQKLSREPLTSTDEVSRMCLFLCCFGQFSGES